MEHSIPYLRYMVLYIKNMVCHRCKLVVQAELETLQLYPINISLGEVTLQESKLSTEKIQQVADAMNRVGFELIDDRKSKLIEKIKTFIIQSIHYTEEAPNKKYSDLLSQQLHHDYSYLSHLFSSVEGVTIEQYTLLQKTEKVKEMLIYNELSLSQIALQLGYSSTAHLSSQFKKITGLTPTEFKQMGKNNRLPLDKVGKAK